jgi:hypothetical protein
VLFFAFVHSAKNVVCEPQIVRNLAVLVVSIGSGLLPVVNISTDQRGNPGCIVEKIVDRFSRFLAFPQLFCLANCRLILIGEASPYLSIGIEKLRCRNQSPECAGAATRI